jgi:uncharacterized protein (TIGR03437 family)
MTRWHRLQPVKFLIALALVTIPAPAYYHFVTYLNGVAVPEKFDLTALSNKTVTVFVSENGPRSYSQNDSFNSVLTQIGQATLAWNGIASSDLRVAFGGLENSSTLQNTPGIDVTFEDLPPGVEGYGGPTSTLNPATAADGSPFIPIVRSSMHLNLNMTILPGPSYNETFYLTTLHEIGHALGLQHTFTSATMSQATTRATTLAHPIGADDIAALSTLYPNANFAQFGSIAGQITSGGSGVHLASVVAIRSGGDAVSAVTNPDGTYRIDGIPPGSYYVYVHTLPPDADIFGPWNPDGSVAPASGPVNTLFWSPSGSAGTPNLVPTAAVSVQKGVVAQAIDIATSPAADVPIYDGQIYGYFHNSQTGITPADINMLGGSPSVVLAASLVTDSNGLAPGLSAQPIGSSIAIDQVYPYPANGFTYYGVQIAFNLGAQTGSQHIVFNTPNFTYVLPAAINLTKSAPPTVTAVNGNGDGTVTVTGTNWASDTLLYFDGLPSSIQSLNSTAGIAIVLPPAGTNNQQTVLTAYNSDGQNSQLVQSSPVTYGYSSAATPAATQAITSITPSSLPAGAEAAIDIVGSGFTFPTAQSAASQIAVGFGTSDVLVQQVFVLSPTHLRVDVLVSPNAALSNPDVSVFNGFQFATATAGLRITPQVAALPVPLPPLVNALPGLTGAYPGAIVSLYGSNLAAGSAIPAITVEGQPVTLLYASPSQLNLQLPSTLTPGPALLTLNNGAAAAFPLGVSVANVPAGINAIQNSSGAYIDATSAAHQGDTLIVTLSNFAPPGAVINANRVSVSVGGVSHPAISPIVQAGAYYQVYFSLNSNDPVGPAEQLIVYLDGNSSYPATIPVTYPDGSFTQ